MTNNPKDANRFGEIGLQCFEDGSLEKDVSEEIQVPNLRNIFLKLLRN